LALENSGVANNGKMKTCHINIKQIGEHVNNSTPVTTATGVDRRTVADIVRLTAGNRCNVLGVGKTSFTGFGNSRYTVATMNLHDASTGSVKRHIIRKVSVNLWELFE